VLISEISGLFFVEEQGFEIDDLRIAILDFRTEKGYLYFFSASSALSAVFL